jgi:hypothetical protein
LGDEVTWAENLLEIRRPYSRIDIEARQRVLMKITHPDAGGSHRAFIDVTRAAEILLNNKQILRPTPDASYVGSKSDHPSFTIDVLPVEAYEYIFLAANVLGQVADEDPPYSLQVLLNEPQHCWCLISVVPEAGGSIVSITVHNADDSRNRNFNIEEIRDTWVSTINEVQLP